MGRVIGNFKWFLFESTQSGDIWCTCPGFGTIFLRKKIVLLTFYNAEVDDEPYSHVFYNT